MKICIVFHDADKYNGATHSMLDLIKTWKAMDAFEMVCILPWDGSVAKELSNMGIRTFIYPYHNVRYYTTDPLYWTAVKNVVKIFRLCADRIFSCEFAIRDMKKLDVDMVYSNTSAIYMGTWIAQALSVPHIWHIREMGEEDQDAKPLLGKWYFRRLLNRASMIIAISDTVQNKYRQMVSDASKIKRIYNDVLIPWSPFYERSVVEKFQVLIVGRLAKGKGQDQVIRAVAGCLSEIPKIQLYIAGRTEGDYYDKLCALVEELGLGEQIHFLGQIQNIHEISRKMHVQIVASRCEAFGRITIEAMAWGLPLIGADTGGTAELITDHINGLLYKYGDVQDLQEKIKFSYYHYADMLSMAVAASEHCRQFIEGNAAKKIAACLSDLK